MIVKATAVALLVAGSASAAALINAKQYGAEAVVKADPDYGLCIPTMKFEGGIRGRPALEFSFLPADPLCSKGQQEALNINIITNRICDQLSTVCAANQAAQTLCRQAQAKIRTLGTRDKSTADTWNTLLGFGGALTNPDGGLAEPDSQMRDLKVKRDVEMEKRAIIPCSTSEWIDTCTGWPAAEPVVKRHVEADADVAAPEPVVKKRSAEPEAEPDPEPQPEPEAEPMVKRSGEAGAKAKRQVEFIACSTTEWLDDCTGWP
ncbi:hypothetical protein A1O1_01168 [Capronia coronata CBS 617.96]|uniref:Uncharacterized protein n=1 Tax=Capronia coronata CBS 617.96 TaxID=1182541 RepID=W9YT16_9EURO|nr:uncharacterized protein A1O1_01168 [Capronia coronata CBS 617.96]EXJ96042.1 hypothetical protein A1O1_01168 [Capronia coronata CBS 617.96]